MIEEPLETRLVQREISEVVLHAQYRTCRSGFAGAINLHFSRRLPNDFRGKS
jgi:hypothetical protein